MNQLAIICNFPLKIKPELTRFRSQHKLRLEMIAKRKEMQALHPGTEEHQRTLRTYLVLRRKMYFDRPDPELPYRQ